MYDRIKRLREEQNMSQDDLAKKCGYSDRSTISKIEKGERNLPGSKIQIIANALGVRPSFLMDGDRINLQSPEITTDTVTFPVIGEIAAGYDSIAIEDWSGDTVEIPTSYLKGRKKEDFFVLSVHGDSMYPLYMNGDKVLILKQSTLNNSGDIGAILYDGEYATLKKVEYVNGEDWLKLIPINPEYQPKKIEGPDLEQCRVIGIPKLLIREIN